MHRSALHRYGIAILSASVLLALATPSVQAQDTATPVSASTTPQTPSGEYAIQVIAKMKEMPTDDPLFGKGTVRADGRKIHPMYLFEVKKPAESKGPWDYYKVRATIPADEAFRPVDQGDCPLVKK